MKTLDISTTQHLALVMDDDAGCFYVHLNEADPIIDEGLSLYYIAQAHTVAAIKRDNAARGLFVYPYRAEEPKDWTRLRQLDMLTRKL